MGKKKSIVLVSVISILIIVFIVLCRNFECEKDLPQIVQEKTLHVVTSSNPIDFYVCKDSISGFQYEILKQFADSMGLKLDIKVEKTMKKSIDGLKKGKYDIIARNILVTTELREKVNFSNPILLNKQVLVQRANSENLIRNQLNLAGETIHVKRNASCLLRIKNLSHEIGDTINIIELKKTNNADLIKLVSEGKINYTVCDQRLAEKHQTPELDIKTAIGFPQIEAWALRKSSPELEESINKFLDSFLKTKAYEDIYNKYYNEVE